MNQKTKRNIYAVIMLALLIVAAISANVICAVILFIMFLLYALSLLSILYMGERGVKVDLDLPESMPQGGTARLTVTAEADRKYYIGNLTAKLKVDNCLTGEGMDTEAAFMMLPPGRGRCRPLPISDQFCGKLRIRMEPLDFTDLLDRVHRDSGESYEKALYVLPTLEILHDSALAIDDASGDGTKSAPKISLLLDSTSEGSRKLAPAARSRLVQKYLSASHTLLSEGRFHQLFWYDGEQKEWKSASVINDASFEEAERGVLAAGFAAPEEPAEEAFQRLENENKLPLPEDAAPESGRAALIVVTSGGSAEETEKWNAFGDVRFLKAD